MRVLRIALLARARVGAGANRVTLLVPPPLEEPGDLVFLRGLPRQSRRQAAHVQIVGGFDAFRPSARDELRHVCDGRLGRLMPGREDPPQLVPQDRAAERSGERFEMVDAVRRRSSCATQPVVDVVLHPVPLVPPMNAEPLNWLPPSFRMLLSRMPPPPVSAGIAAVLTVISDLQRVVEKAQRRPLVALDRHALDELIAVETAESAGAQAHLLGRLHAAHVGRARTHARRRSRRDP